MKFFRPIEQRKISVSNLNPTHESVVLYIPSIVNPLFLETDDSVPSEPVHKMHNDVYLLFNQERLNNLGLDSLRHFLDSLSPKIDNLAQLRQNVSDERLLQFVKSRRLQEPSEIRVWMEYLANEYGKQTDTIHNVVKSLESKPDTSDTTSE